MVPGAHGRRLADERLELVRGVLCTACIAVPPASLASTAATGIQELAYIFYIAGGAAPCTGSQWHGVCWLSRLLCSWAALSSRLGKMQGRSKGSDGTSASMWKLLPRFACAGLAGMLSYAARGVLPGRCVVRCGVTRPTTTPALATVAASGLRTRCAIVWDTHCQSRSQSLTRTRP